MNALLKAEEAAMFAAGLFAFSLLEMSWWWFAAFILLPDIGMIGYFHNPRTGAWSYNLFHHKGIALSIILTGYLIHNNWVLFIGIILFTHASMDRIFGYGLKHEKGFKFTHLARSEI